MIFRNNWKLELHMMHWDIDCRSFETRAPAPNLEAARMRRSNLRLIRRHVWRRVTEKFRRLRVIHLLHT